MLTQNLTALIPFIPTMRGGADEKIIERAQSQLLLNETLRENGMTGDYNFALTVFASAMLGSDKARQIFGGIMLDFIVESPFYQEIIGQGMEKGLQKGLQEGTQLGLQEGREKILLRLLTRKFGRLDGVIERQVHALSAEQSEELADAIFDFETLPDFENWLLQKGVSVE